MEALRFPWQVTRGAHGTGCTVTRPQGQCSASSLQGPLPQRRSRALYGPSPLQTPQLTLVKMGPEAAFSNHVRAGFLSSGVCLIDFGRNVLNPRKILGAKVLGGPGSGWDSTFCCHLSAGTKSPHGE